MKNDTDVMEFFKYIVTVNRKISPHSLPLVGGNWGDVTYGIRARVETLGIIGLTMILHFYFRN